MAKMNNTEAVEKIRLMNRGESFKLITKNRIGEDGIYIYIEGDPASLVLSDPAIGDLFEWVDTSHKQLKAKGDDSLIINVRNVSEFPTTGIKIEVNGPNSSMINKINGIINSMIIPADNPAGKKGYLVDGGTRSIEDTEESKAKFDALMALLEALDPKKVFDGAGKDEVMEFKMKIKGTDGKTVRSIFVNKKSMHLILKHINILKTMSDEFELPNEFYQMILDGYGFTMKNEVGKTTQLPEPKYVSETVGEYEDRLKTKLGSPGMDTDRGIRNPYTHEKTDYSATVTASATIMGDNPTTSGAKVDDLPTDTDYRSDYYTHMAGNVNKKKKLTFVDTDTGRPVKSNVDEKLTTKIKTNLQAILRFVGDHKLACLITAAVVIGGAATIISTGGACFGTLWTIARYSLHAIGSPIPKMLLGMSINIGDVIIAAAEIAGLVALVRKIYKKRKKKRDAKKVPKEVEIQQLEDLIAAQQEAIENANNIIIASNITINSPHSTDDEKNLANIRLQKANALIEKSNLQIAAAQERLKQLRPMDITEEEAGFTRPEEFEEGGLSL